MAKAVSGISSRARWKEPASAFSKKASSLWIRGRASAAPNAAPTTQATVAMATPLGDADLLRHDEVLASCGRRRA